MKFEVTRELFKDLYPLIMDNNVTDIKWNGRDLWIDDITKGRYKSDIKLTNKFLEILTTRIANHSNTHFNFSEPSLQAETDELRFHAIHPFRTGDGTYVLAIRKTPAVARLNRKTILSQRYADELTIELLGALVRCHSSGIIIGDVGSGKTEFEKFIASFIPENESVLTVEDTLEMKLPVIYPNKDISSVKIDNNYTAVTAIRDALRLLTKWLLIAEARGREINTIIEGASTGCVAWTTIHTENVWEIPDRILQMAGPDADKEGLEDNVFMFFNVGIKIRRSVTHQGIHRNIDQICFFDRQGKTNEITLFMKGGKYTGNKVPKYLVDAFEFNGEEKLLNMLKSKNLI